MGLLSRAAREARYVRGLSGALGAIRTVASDSPNLVADDWERMVDLHAARPALSMTGAR
jgi:fatty-acyl-CoA synthase